MTASDSESPQMCRWCVIVLPDQVNPPVGRVDASNLDPVVGQVRGRRGLGELGAVARRCGVWQRGRRGHYDRGATTFLELGVQLLGLGYYYPDTKK